MTVLGQHFKPHFSKEEVHQVINQNAGVDSDLIPEEGQKDMSKLVTDIIRSERAGTITQTKRDEWTEYLVDRAVAFLHKECPNYKKIQDKVAE